MLVEVWSDLVCPWCYLGKRRLEQALERFPHRDRVDVVWRSFELEPDAPATAESRATLLVTRYGMTPEQAAERDAHMTALAAEAGLEYRPELVQLGNTFDAHRMLHAAAAAGRQAQANERLLRGYFSEGRALTDADTLVELAAEAGVDADAARAAIGDGSYAAEVRGGRARGGGARHHGRAVLRARTPLRRLRRPAGGAPAAGARTGLHRDRRGRRAGAVLAPGFGARARRVSQAPCGSSYSSSWP